MRLRLCPAASARAPVAEHRKAIRCNANFAEFPITSCALVVPEESPRRQVLERGILRVAVVAEMVCVTAHVKNALLRAAKHLPEPLRTA